MVLPASWCRVVSHIHSESIQIQRTGTGSNWDRSPTDGLALPEPWPVMPVLGVLGCYSHLGEGEPLPHALRFAIGLRKPTSGHFRGGPNAVGSGGIGFSGLLGMLDGLTKIKSASDPG